MNKKIYSLVWNKSLRQIVVASELASVKSGGGSSGATSGARRTPHGAVLGLAAVGALCMAPWSGALAGQTDCSGATAAGNKALACGDNAIAHGNSST
ncbi:MAG: ESPR-type extended signal peptide-containing protein, partial [Rhodanobacteraceae bacterium]